MTEFTPSMTFWKYPLVDGYVQAGYCTIRRYQGAPEGRPFVLRTPTTSPVSLLRNSECIESS